MTAYPQPAFPSPGYYYPPPPPTPRTSGAGVAALVLGIVGAVIGLIPIVGVGAILFGLLALIFGLVGWTSRGVSHAMPIAGVVLGMVSLLFGALTAVALYNATNPTVDQQEMQRDVGQLVSDRFANGKKVENVSCPAGQSATVGYELDCTLTLGGRPHTVHLKMAGGGTYEVNPPRPT